MASLVALPANAWADEARVEPPTPAVVSEALANVDGSLLSTPSGSSGVGVVRVDGGTIEVPARLTQGVTIGYGNSEISVDLPGSRTADDAAVLSDGTVVYPSERFSNAVIVSDRGVQMLTTIPDASAPTAFSYEVALRPGQRLTLVDGGGVAVIDADGTIVAGVAAPWARDANGDAVATRYVVEGSKLTQVVDHSAADIEYPVIADPFWLAPWIVRCLIGIGLNGPQISRIASAGSPGSILAAFGFGALRCVLGR